MYNVMVQKIGSKYACVCQWSTMAHRAIKNEPMGRKKNHVFDKKNWLTLLATLTFARLFLSVVLRGFVPCLL